MLIYSKGVKVARYLLLYQKKSRLALVDKAINDSANKVTRVTLELLSPSTDYLHTITYDNGKEFSYHTEISQKIGATSYLAHLSHYWERRLNKNTNGLLSQYFPKGVRLENTKQENVVTAMCRLNWRPRKCLGFKNPYDTFLDHTNQQKLGVSLST